MTSETSGFDYVHQIDTSSVVITVCVAHSDVINCCVALVAIASLRLEDETKRFIDRSQRHADVIPPASKKLANDVKKLVIKDRVVDDIMTLHAQRPHHWNHKTEADSD